MNLTMKAAQISKPGGDFELVERDIPEPGAAQVRVKVEACGICHSDFVVKEGMWPGLQYPRVPGHEVAGRVDAVGGNVTNWKKGQRVGVGWHGGHCFVCEQCRRGDFAMCVNRKVTGIDFDGGYAEYMIAPAEAVAAIPDELPPEEAGPFMCAGVTVYNALRNSGARAGDVVAVHGIGGLGHLGVQYARQMGFETVALGRGKDKELLAKKLGAHHYNRFGQRQCGGGIAKARRRESDPGDGAELAGDFSAGGRIVSGRQARYASRSYRTPDYKPDVVVLGKAIRIGLVLRYRERFAGHIGIQRAERRAPDDREISAEPRGRSLRTDAQRQSAVPRCPNYERIVLSAVR